MQRRSLLALGSGAALLPAMATAAPALSPLPAPPAGGRIDVAFLLGEGAEVLDFAGPWEVFDNVAPFRLHTVARSTAPLRATGGLRVVPDHDFDSAPAARVVVVPAMKAPDEATLAWLRRASASADLVMSVCNGAFVVARAGLLDGLSATAHHESYGEFAASFDAVRLVRGVRFVDNGRVATSGGLASGIDLALHVVARYFGAGAAAGAARHLEHLGNGWRDPSANAEFARRRVATAQHPFCQVCEMDVARDGLRTSWHGRMFWFCMPEHLAKFEAKPQRFA